jgi:signal transduction histidine kinase
VTRAACLRAAVVGAALAVTALAVDSAAALAWRALSNSHRTPPVWVLLLATVAVAVALPAVQRVTWRFASRLVYGDRAGGYAVMSEFVGRLAGSMSVDDVLPRLAETAARSAHSRRGEVRLWLADGREQRQVWPPDAAQGAAEVAVSVRHGGASVGELAVESAPEGAERRDDSRGPGLAKIAGPAGLALSTVRLTYDLRRRLAEVADLHAQLDASHRRVLDARRAQRQQVRDELGDAVAPLLAQAGTALERAGTALAAEPVAWDRCREQLSRADEAARAALEGLRRLSHGVFPPLLGLAGPGSAIRAWAEHAQLAVQLRDEEPTGGILDGARFAPGTEACLYFCCVTALAGLRAEPAAPVMLSFGLADDDLWFRLSWSQSGGMLPVSVVLDLQDRLESLDGGLSLPSAQAGRVHVEGRLPTRCAAKGD